MSQNNLHASDGANRLRRIAIQQMSPMEPGLYIVSCSDKAIEKAARAALEMEALTAGVRIGLRMPKVDTLLSLHAGDQRSINAAYVAMRFESMPENAAEHAIIAYGARRDFNWCSNEGLCGLLPEIQRATGWLTLSQRIAFPLSPSIVDGLAQIRNAAKGAGVFVMFFMTNTQSEDLSTIADFCDEFIQIDYCEPGPSVLKTFSIRVESLSDLEDHGIGITMCDVRLVNERYRREYSRFIAKTLLDRIIWRLRCEGESLAEIGRLVGMSASTVLRRLSRLPPIHPMKFAEGWFDKYSELLQEGQDDEDCVDDEPNAETEHDSMTDE